MYNADLDGDRASTEGRAATMIPETNTKGLKALKSAKVPASRTEKCTAKFPAPVNASQQVQKQSSTSTCKSFTPSKQCLEALERAVSLLESGERGEASRAAGRVLKQKTLDNRRQHLKRLRDNIEGGIMAALLAPESTVDRLKERLTNPGTLEQTLRVVMTVFTEAAVDKLCSELHTRWRQVLAPVADAAKAHQSRPREGGSQLFLRAVYKRQELHRDPATRYNEDHLLLSMFTCVPPRRSQDYGNVMLLGPGTAGPTPTQEQIAATGGVWYLEGAEQGPTRLTLRRFKTDSAFKGQKERAAYRRGQSTEGIEPFNRVVDDHELLEVVRGSLKRRPRHWLFTMARVSKKGGGAQASGGGATRSDGGVPYHDGDSFGQHVRTRLRALLGEEVNIDKLRESYALWADDQRPSADQLETICDWMGHSVETHMRMYLRRKATNTIPGLGCKHASSAAATPAKQSSQGRS
jgi:hypothetical protein